MSFLTGMFLWALPLAAVPVVIHLFNRRRRDVVRWGAMQFLLDSHTKKRRIWRVDDLLLMLLRAAAVLMIIFALAQPLVRSSWLGGAAGRDVILIIDTSMSMSQELEGETVFELAINKADEELAELGEGDSIRVLLASTGPQWLTPTPLAANSEGKSQLRQRLAELKPTLATADLFAAIQAAVDAEVPPSATSRVIAVLTDGSHHGWRSDATGQWMGIQRNLQNGKIDTSINVLALSNAESPVENLSIDAVETTRTLAGVNEPLNITAQITNRGPSVTEPVLLEWEQDGEALGVSSVESLQPGQSVAIPFEHSINSPGIFRIACRLSQDDQLKTDNVGALVVEVIDRVPVLVVEPSTSTVGERDDADYLLAAMGLGAENKQAKENPDEREQGETVFEPKLISTKEIDGLDLAPFHVIVLADSVSLTDSALASLHQYVEQGGGLWIAPGEQTDPEVFNERLYRAGEGLSPLPLGEPQGDENNRDEFDLVHPPEAEHAATTLLADTQRLDVDEVKIYRRHRFKQPRGSNEVSVLLRSGRGEMLAVENFVGRGRVLVQTMPVGLSWSNLPLCQVYVPLVHEWLWYAAEPAVASRNLQPGEAAKFVYEISEESEAEVTALIETPVGEPITLSPSIEETHGLFEFRQTQLPGEYTLTVNPESDSPQRVPFHVVRDAEESDLTPLDEPQRELLTQAAGLRFTSDLLSQPKNVQATPPREPIWNHLLTVFLLFLIAEMLLAFWSTTRRFSHRAAAMSAGNSLGSGV